MSTVTVIEPDPLIRSGLIRLLSDAGHAVVANAATVADVPRQRQVAVLVLGLGPVDPDVIGELDPDDQPVLAVAEALTDVELTALLSAGIQGVLLRRSVPTLLVHAVGSVVAGGVFLDPLLVPRLVAILKRGQPGSGPRGLTTQERRVLALLPQGPTNREIADQLGISVHTVKTHLRNAMGKLGAYDRVDAARIVVAEGLDEL